MIIYSKSSGARDSFIGRLETPIKMLIEHESDILAKKGNVAEMLFNTEKSNRFGETIIASTDFDVVQATNEGTGASVDNITEAYKKFIEHIQFTKEFIITAEMMEDATVGIAAEAKRRVENFTRAYYKTINKLCTQALANGMNETTNFANAKVDLTTADGNPLFYKSHKWGTSTGTNGLQSNYFYGNIFTKKGSSEASCEAFEEALTELAFKIRNMKDENGEPLGYVADTIVLPGNRPLAETVVKRVCGSFGTTGSSNNDININYGLWNVIVLPTWQANADTCLIMSSEANKNLCGNMFFNRVPLTVTNWVDYHTGNYIWNGRCRFGVGFGSYKHIVCAVNSDNAVTNASAL